jgi:signal transduction histidine kinase/ActR/RegA family two-component response regulator
MAGHDIEPVYNTVLVRKDGTRVHAELSAGVITYQGATADLVLVRDTTERKLAEEERERLVTHIQEQARQAQQILKTVPEGVLLLDASGRIVLTNPVAEAFLSVLADTRPGQVLGRLGDRELVELLTSPPTEGLWHQVTAGDRTFEVIARPMENGPMPEEWVLVLRDVTREREVQQRIRRQERLAAVGQLAAGIAHDFNNIMAVIVLYNQMALRETALSPETRGRLETVSRQARRATDLIQQILDFSRRAVLERRPMSLTPFLKEQVKLLERTLPEHIEIDLVYGTEEYAVNADPTRMQQVIMNLAINARDAMPRGGELRIELARRRVESSKEAPLPEMEPGQCVRVTVTDTGTGIPANALPHIFEPFFTTKAPGQGVGLGLAQVYGIVAQHGGHIDVATRLGEGTTFTFYLPALAAVEPTVPPERVKAMPHGQGETILVVEDDDTMREALVDSLKLLNYQVLATANGLQALAVLRKHGTSVVLVLSDLVMPEMGGQALFYAIRQLGLMVPMMVLTGHPMKEELERLAAEGLSEWLFKPPDLASLAQAVAKILKAH